MCGGYREVSVILGFVTLRMFWFVGNYGIAEGLVVCGMLTWGFSGKYLILSGWISSWLSGRTSRIQGAWVGGTAQGSLGGSDSWGVPLAFGFWDFWIRLLCARKLFFGFRCCRF